MRVGFEAPPPCGVRGLIGRIGTIEMAPPALRRALDPVPIPVRTLDAIHLAAIEFIRARYDERRVDCDPQR
jgi:hypothetical protein